MSNLFNIIPYEQYIIERDCFDVAVRVDDYDQNGDPVIYGMKEGCPDWDMVAALGRKWEAAIRPHMGSKVVEKYRSGDLSLEDIKKGLKPLIYDMASRFAHEERKMFIKQERSLGLITDPFCFDDVELNRRADRTIIEALGSYNPSKGKKFSTYFFDLFEKDLLDLYKTYKGKSIEVKDRDHFDELGLTWTDTFISIPNLTSIPTDDLTNKEKRWMSLVLETPPWYILNAICRSQKMGYKSDEPDREIREGLREKLSGHYKNSSRKFELTSNIYGDPDIPDPTAETVFRILAGEIPTLEPAKLVKTKWITITGTRGMILTPKENNPSWNTGFCGACGFSLTTDKKCSNTNTCKTYMTNYVKKRLKIE